MLLKNSLKGFFLFVLFLLYVSAAPKEEERPTHVPFMDVVEYFDLDYEFQSTTGTLKLVKEERSLILQLGSYEVYDGEGRIHHMKVQPLLSEAQILLPANGVDLIIERLLKLYVSWEYVDGIFNTYKGPKPAGRYDQRQREKQTSQLLKPFSNPSPLPLQKTGQYMEQIE